MPLPSSLRGSFERSLATDLGDVRLHTDDGAATQASAVGARAFATGNNISFAAGEYQPGSTSGQRLIAEEVAHTVQQRGAKASGPLSTTAPGDPVERQADDAAAAMIAGQRARVTPQPLAIARNTPAPAGPVTPPPPPNMQHPPGYKPPPVEKGDNENQEIGTWDDTTKIKSTKLIGLYDSEAAAMAQANTAGAVILENGKYAAYRIVTDAWFESFTYDNCKVLKNSDFTTVWIKAPWLAVTTEDSVVLRPSQHNTDAAKKVMTPELMLKPGESPFGGFPELFKGKDISDGKLFEAFEAAMKKAALDILRESEEQVQKKKDQFRDKKGTSQDELKLIRDTAKKLVDKDAEILKASEDESNASGSIDPKSSDAAELRRQRDEARRRKERLQEERKKIEQEYPMLARQDPKKIVGAGDDEITKLLGDDTIQILKDIATARDDTLTGDLKLWGLPGLIESTIAGCGITDQDRRNKIKDHAKDLALFDSISKGIQTAFAIGLGLLAAFSTGGLALVAAAGALGLSTYDAMAATKQYSVDSAAANTDLNPELALQVKDVSGEWKWVALAWVGVGLDIGSVASALKGVKSIGEVAQAAEQLAKGSDDLLKKLKVLAGIVKDGEVVSEVTRRALGLKLGTQLEIRGPGTYVHVMYEMDEQTGRVLAKGVRCGAEATVKDILAHSDLVKLLNRYEGVTGKMREIVERFLSIAPDEAALATKNIPKGSQAWESWHEVQKLKKIVKSRMQQLEKGAGKLAPDAEEALRRDVSFLEDEIKRHQECVDNLSFEKGSGFIAKGEHVTEEAIKTGKMPDFRNHPGIPKDHHQYYYYRRNGAGYELCTRQDAPAGVKRLTLGPNKEIIEGAPSAAQKAKMLVASWNADQQAAFEALEKLAQSQGAFRVVPLQGVKTTGRKVGEAFTGAQKAQMQEIYTNAWMAKGLSESEAAKKAAATVKKVMDHDITLVQGTEQLRLFDYAKKYPGKPIGELHHDIPLYLGGDHKVLTDIGKVKVPGKGELDLHDELHKLIDQAKFKDGGSLAPHDLGKTIPTEPGAAVLRTGGEIDFYKLSGTGPATKMVPVN